MRVRWYVGTYSFLEEGVLDRESILDFLEAVPGYELEDGDREDKPKVKRHGHEHLAVIEHPHQEIKDRGDPSGDYLLIP